MGKEITMEEESSTAVSSAKPRKEPQVFRMDDDDEALPPLAELPSLAEIEKQADHYDRLEKLRMELASMKLSGLQARALELGVPRAKVDAATDEDVPRDALTSLILAFESGTAIPDDGEPEAPSGIKETTTWFEVSAAKISLKEAPNPNATSIATMFQGDRIEVQGSVIGDDGYMWKQLTEAQLVCSGVDIDEYSKGFVLFDGTHAGLGRLLHGPVEPPKPQVPQTPTHEYFEVLKSLVLVKERPNKNIPSIGQVRMGSRLLVNGKRAQDSDGNLWVELTSRQMQHSCPNVGSDVRGFCLIDGTHLGIGRLLNGPLPYPTEEELLAQYQAEYEVEMTIAQEQAQKREIALRERSVVEENKRLEKKRCQLQDALLQLQQEGEAMRLRNSERHLDAVPYRSMGNSVSLIEAKDPGTGIIKSKPCSYMQRFFSTGTVWHGEDSSVWLEHSVEWASWFLFKDGEGQHHMKKEADINNYIQVSVDYVASVGDIHIFHSFTPTSASIADLIALVCRQTGLSSRSVILMRPNERDSMSEGLKGSEIAHEPEPLDRSRTLDSYKFSSRAQLYLLYNGDFLEDYKPSVRLRISSQSHLVSLAKKLPKGGATRNGFQSILNATRNRNS